MNTKQEYIGSIKSQQSKLDRVYIIIGSIKSELSNLDQVNICMYVHLYIKISFIFLYIHKS